MGRVAQVSGRPHLYLKCQAEREYPHVPRHSPPLIEILVSAAISALLIFVPFAPPYKELHFSRAEELAPTQSSKNLSQSDVTTKPCSCILFARSRLPNLPRVNTPADLEPNSDRRVGNAVLLKENLPHIAILEEITPEGILISEQNYSDDPTCPVTTRFLPHNSERIRGFYSPTK